MKRSVKGLVGFAIGATDGELGKVKEFYFDDRTWTIRYLIAEPGNWLSGRKVLISPVSLLLPDWECKVFPVDLTREQVKKSPDIDTDKPVSLQQEWDLSKYYSRTGFWGGGRGAGGSTTGMMMPVQESIEQAIQNEEDNDPPLRSTDKVIGYNIKAADIDIGMAEDFIVDDSNLHLIYMVVDTDNWFPAKKVIISPKWIKEIKWDTSEVVANANVEQVKSSPEYNVSKYLDDVYERSLTNYYGRFIS